MKNMREPHPKSEETPLGLAKFERRVRIVRSWRGMALGCTIGAGLASVWAVLDYIGVWFTDWTAMGSVFLAAGCLGAAIGLLTKVSKRDLAISIDRRANLQDRTASTMALSETDSPEFSVALREDALNALNRVQPSHIYPIRVGRPHLTALALAAVAASIFLLGNSPLLLSKDAQEAKKKMQEEAKRVERVLAATLDDPEDRTRMTEAEKRLADELRKLQKDLEKARMKPEEALQRANAIEKQAQELMKESAKDSLKQLERAESLREKMVQGALKEAGLANVNPKMAQLSASQRQEAMAANRSAQAKAQANLSALEQQMSALREKLRQSGLSADERARLEKELEELAKQAADQKEQLQKLEQQMEQLKLSEKAQAVLDKMMRTPEWQKLQELAAKMAEAQKSAQKAATGQPPTLSREERLRLEKELNELLESLADEQAMKEYLQALLEAMNCSGGT